MYVADACLFAGTHLVDGAQSTGREPSARSSGREYRAAGTDRPQRPEVGAVGVKV